MSNSFHNLNVNSLVCGSGIKERVPVRTVTTTPLNLSVTLIGVVINGYTLQNNDRVLITAQSTGAENGIYCAADTPYRAADYVTGDLSFSFMTVTDGTYARTTWQATSS